MENFVIMELVKQAGWSKTNCRITHFRDNKGHEVDCVIERNDGQIVGVEIKGGTQVGTEDFGGLRVLKALAGEKFKRGIVVYAGNQSLRFDKDLIAVGLGGIW